MAQRTKPRSKNTPSSASPSSSDAPNDHPAPQGNCNHCGTPGHYWRNCPYRKHKRAYATAATAVDATLTPTLAFVHLELLDSVPLFGVESLALHSSAAREWIVDSGASQHMTSFSSLL